MSSQQTNSLFKKINKTVYNDLSQCKIFLQRKNKYKTFHQMKFDYEII